MFYIIDNTKQLQELIDCHYDVAFLHIIEYDNAHPKLNSPTLFYYRPLKGNKGFICGLNHPDIQSTPLVKIVELFKNTRVLLNFNKRDWIYYLPKEIWNNLYDIGISYNLKSHSTLKTKSKYTFNHRNNQVIPLVKHYEYCELLFEELKDYFDLEFDKIPMYHWYNNTMLEQLYKIEQHGIKVDTKIMNGLNSNYNNGDIVYPYYNINTITTRPSNTFNGLNLAALSKTSGIRKAFKPVNDYFVEFDYDAYHLRILAYLINYTFEYDSIHTELAKYYFDTEDVSDEQYNMSKQFSFKQMYGGIDKKYMHIPYFYKINQFNDKIWTDFNENGYVNVLGSVFYKDKISNISKTALLSYYIQKMETIFNINIIEKIWEYIEETKISTKLVLYNYDSFVFDVVDDDAEHLLNIKNIISKQFKVKIKRSDTLSF